MLFLMTHPHTPTLSIPHLSPPTSTFPHQAFNARPPASEAQDQCLQDSLRAFPLEGDPLAARHTHKTTHVWRRKMG